MLRWIALFAAALLAVPAEPVPFATLSGFPYVEGMELPAEVQRLDGKAIRITGFIRTEDGRVDDIATFWLVDQNCDCQGRPKINEMIYCELPDGETIDNDDAPIEVEGVFSAGEERDGDYIVSLYRMQVTRVR